MLSRQSNIPRVKRLYGKAAGAIRLSGRVGGQTAMQSGQFAAGILGKYGFWRNPYLGLLTLIFRENGLMESAERNPKSSGGHNWLVQFQLQLQGLQHPDSSHLSSKKETVHVLEKWVERYGPHMTAVSPSSTRPSQERLWAERRLAESSQQLPAQQAPLKQESQSSNNAIPRADSSSKLNQEQARLEHRQAPLDLTAQLIELQQKFNSHSQRSRNEKQEKSIVNEQLSLEPTKRGKKQKSKPANRPSEESQLAEERIGDTHQTSIQKEDVAGTAATVQSNIQRQHKVNTQSVRVDAGPAFPTGNSGITGLSTGYLTWGATNLATASAATGLRQSGTNDLTERIFRKNKMSIRVAEHADPNNKGFQTSKSEFIQAQQAHALLLNRTSLNHTDHDEGSYLQEELAAKGMKSSNRLGQPRKKAATNTIQLYNNSYQRMLEYSYQEQELLASRMVNRRGSSRFSHPLQSTLTNDRVIKSANVPDSVMDAGAYEAAGLNQIEEAEVLQAPRRYSVQAQAAALYRSIGRRHQPLLHVDKEEQQVETNISGRLKHIAPIMEQRNSERAHHTPLTELQETNSRQLQTDRTIAAPTTMMDAFSESRHEGYAVLSKQMNFIKPSWGIGQSSNGYVQSGLMAGKHVPDFIENGAIASNKRSSWEAKQPYTASGASRASNLYRTLSLQADTLPIIQRRAVSLEEQTAAIHRFIAQRLSGAPQAPLVMAESASVSEGKTADGATFSGNNQALGTSSKRNGSTSLYPTRQAEDVPNTPSDRDRRLDTNNTSSTHRVERKEIPIGIAFAHTMLKSASNYAGSRVSNISNSSAAKHINKNISSINNIIAREATSENAVLPSSRSNNISNSNSHVMSSLTSRDITHTNKLNLSYITNHHHLSNSSNGSTANSNYVGSRVSNISNSSATKHFNNNISSINHIIDREATSINAVLPSNRSNNISNSNSHVMSSLTSGDMTHTNKLNLSYITNHHRLSNSSNSSTPNESSNVANNQASSSDGINSQTTINKSNTVQRAAGRTADREAGGNTLNSANHFMLSQINHTSLMRSTNQQLTSGPTYNETNSFQGNKAAIPSNLISNQRNIHISQRINSDSGNNASSSAGNNVTSSPISYSTQISTINNYPSTGLNAESPLERNRSQLTGDRAQEDNGSKNRTTNREPWKNRGIAASPIGIKQEVVTRTLRLLQQSADMAAGIWRKEQTPARRTPIMVNPAGPISTTLSMRQMVSGEKESAGLNRPMSTAANPLIRTDSGRGSEPTRRTVSTNGIAANSDTTAQTAIPTSSSTVLARRKEQESEQPSKQTRRTAPPVSLHSESGSERLKPIQDVRVQRSHSRVDRVEKRLQTTSSSLIHTKQMSDKAPIQAGSTIGRGLTPDRLFTQRKQSASQVDREVGSVGSPRIAEANMLNLRLVRDLKDSASTPDLRLERVVNNSNEVLPKPVSGSRGQALVERVGSRVIHQTTIINAKQGLPASGMQSITPRPKRNLMQRSAQSLSVRPAQASAQQAVLQQASPLNHTPTTIERMTSSIAAMPIAANEFGAGPLTHLQQSQEQMAMTGASMEHKQASGSAPSDLSSAPLDMDWLKTVKEAQVETISAKLVEQPAPQIDIEQLKELVKKLPQLDVNKMADRVYREIEKKMKFERQRRGV